MDLQTFVKSHPVAPQRHYEAIRAFYVDQLSERQIADQFGFSESYFRQLLNEAQERLDAGEWPFFAVVKPGPKARFTQDNTVQTIVNLRKNNHSISEIKCILDAKNDKLSLDTIHRILKAEGFAPLPRRSRAERLSTPMPKVLAAPAAQALEWVDEEFTTSKGACALLFLPLIKKLKIAKSIQSANFPTTASISDLSYLLSFLALKLVNNERLSHDTSWNLDRGLGLFAGLNVLPKNSSMSSYSYRVSRDMNRQLLIAMSQAFRVPDTEEGDFNLDFHSIPHWGDISNLEKNWVGTRGRAMKSVLALIVQDPGSGHLSYANSSIERGQQNQAVLEFVDFWKEARGESPKMLIFDSKFTSYQNLAKLDEDGIKFITLRRRGARLREKVADIPEEQWKWVHVEGIGRKHPKVRVHESLVSLRGYDRSTPLRQVIITENGRKEPAFLVTNDLNTTLPALVRKYGRRWLVEKDINEQIMFFHLNRLSSSIVVKVDFDLTLTLLAHNLYRMLASHLPRHQQCEAPTIFRDFLDNTAKVAIKGRKIIVKLNKKSHLPLLLEVPWLKEETYLPWLKAHIQFEGFTSS